MDSINTLTRRGKQHREAIKSCQARYEELPESRLREALIAAAEKAVRLLHREPKYRTADAPRMPDVGPYVPPPPKPTHRATIPLRKLHDINHIQATNTPPRESVIQVRVTKVPRVPGGADK